ncbi:MAG: sigma-70 family RNA polymerase sigma factor, partial [Ignavibacteriales bacterium]
MATNALAVMSPEGGLSRYLSEIRKFPMLAKDEEFMLAKRWQEHEDPEAAHRLVTSHLRLVAKIAMGYRGYGLPIGEVISEGNVGLMQAVKKFDPDRGFRLATYAMWWIRASIQEYMLAKRYQEHEDPEAAAQLVTSHLRLVAKIAMGYRGYGLPVSDLI